MNLSHRISPPQFFLRHWARWPNRGAKRALLMLGVAIAPQSVRGLAKRMVGKHQLAKWVKDRELQASGIGAIHRKRATFDNAAKGRRLVEQLRLALTGSGLPSLSRHRDRTSMRWSVESRVPFLTIELAGFLLTLPESYLLSNGGETKRIFGYAMHGLVPDTILDRRDKIGFQTPEQD